MRTKLMRICAVILAALLPVCAACDGSRKVQEMRSKGLYSGQTVTFPIASNHAFLGGSYDGVTSFRSKQDPDELRTRIEADGVVQVSAKQRSSGTWGDGDALIMLRDNGDGTSDHFSLLVTSHTQEGFFYVLCPLGAEIRYAGEQDVQKSFSLLLPLHLIRKYDVWAAYYMDIEYETDGSEYDFYDFYARSGWFDLQKGSSGFLIRGFRPGVDLQNPRAETDFAYRFVFRQVLDITLFKIVKA